jgi:hypothetical protein
MDVGKRKGDGIPLLVYGRNGKKEVEDWWERWKAGADITDCGSR